MDKRTNGISSHSTDQIDGHRMNYLAKGLVIFGRSDIYSAKNELKRQVFPGLDDGEFCDKISDFVQRRSFPSVNKPLKWRRDHGIVYLATAWTYFLLSSNE